MKKIIISAIFTVGLLPVFAQPKMQGTIKPGSAAGTIEIWAKPSAGYTQKDEAMTFSLAIPATVQPAPALGTSGSHSNTTGPVVNITGLRPNFLVNNLGCTLREVVTSEETIEAKSYFIYTFIFAGTALNNHVWVADTEQLLFSISFEGCTNNCGVNAIKMVSLPNGGNTQNAWWYFQPNTLGDITNYPAPFYANAFTGLLVNGGSANGSALSTIELAMALPVQMEMFDAVINDCKVEVNWKVTKENDFSYYSIERSVNGQNFFEVGRVNATRENVLVKSYRFADKNGPSGKIFYRLRMVNTDGKYSFSQVKEINNNCKGNNGIVVYPNPTSGVINVILPQGAELSTVKLLNASGQVVALSESGNLYRLMDAKKLPAGVYTVQVIDTNNASRYVKVVLQK